MADAIRRVVAVGVATCGLVLTSPLMGLAALGIRLTLGSGILFRQERLGVGGRPFMLLKLRTMRHATSDQSGPEHDAERLTRLGVWLRRTSVDELPSFWNVLRGDVGLVGPRPLPVHYWNRFRGDEYRRFEVKPGITGLAQVSGRNAVDWDERLALDVHYVRERSLIGDMRILVQTVPIVIGRSGIGHGDSATMHALPDDRPDRAPIP